MTNIRARRISRELFLATVGANLGGLEWWVTDRLAEIVEEEDVHPGDCVFARGASPTHFYYTRQGILDMTRDGNVVQSVQGPHSFGVLDALLGRPRVFSARARTPLHLLKVKTEKWLELLEDSFELARTFVLGLARVVAELEERLWASGRAETEPELPALAAPGRTEIELVDRLALLERTPFLRGTGVQALCDLAMAATDLVLGPGEPLFERIGADRVAIVAHGVMEARRESPHLVWRGGPHTVVCGAAAFLGAGPQRLAHAVSTARLLTFGIEDWFDVMEEHFEMVRSTLAALAMERERLMGMAAP